MSFRLPAAAIAAALLAGCASTPLPVTPGRPATPAAPVVLQPSADWENLGVSPNGNILNELDKLSIRREGSRVTFRDRKTIFNLKSENFLSTPRHKVSINTWQVDCSARTFRLLSLELYDENGRAVPLADQKGQKVLKVDYTNDERIRPQPVVQNSASYQQMLYVCKGQDSF